MKKVTHLYTPGTLYEPEVRGQHGVITIVSELKEHDIFYYGLSLCLPGDNFSKKIGVEIASNRCDDDLAPFHGEFVYTAKHNYQQILLYILVDILSNMDGLPEWAKKMIKNELVTVSLKVTRPDYD